MKPVLSCILNRRSIRSYSTRKVTRDMVMDLIRAACWAPSGKNGQPWKFAVIMDDEKKKRDLASLTIYRSFAEQAPCLIAVFLDKHLSYDQIKDLQAMGAAVQNILLAAHEMGLGTCWIGEILGREDDVRKLLDLPDYLKLMALITVGYPEDPAGKGKRRPEKDSIALWI